MKAPTGKPTAVNASAITSWRRRSHQLARPALTTPQQVVARLGGVQAQDEGWARWWRIQH